MKIKDLIISLGIKYIASRLLHYAILLTLMLAAGFAVGWPRYRRFQKDMIRWKVESLSWKIQSLPRIVFNASMCIIIGILDIVADKFDALAIFQKPKELFKFLFLTQRTQAAIDIWARDPDYWNDKQKFFFKRIVKIANKIDHDKDGTKPHFILPAGLTEIW